MYNTSSKKLKRWDGDAKLAVMAKKNVVAFERRQTVGSIGIRLKRKEG